MPQGLGPEGVADDVAGGAVLQHLRRGGGDDDLGADGGVRLFCSVGVANDEGDLAPRLALEPAGDDLRRLPGGALPFDADDGVAANQAQLLGRGAVVHAHDGKAVVTGHGADADAHHLLVGHAGLEGGVFFGREVHGVGVAQGLDDLFYGLRVQGRLGDVVDVIFAQQVLQLVGGQRLGRRGQAQGRDEHHGQDALPKSFHEQGSSLQWGQWGQKTREHRPPVCRAAR